MHQTWGKLLFMHWRIDANLLRPLLPPQLDIDLFDGSAWIGVIPFTMWDIRALFLPPVPGTSAFHELNVRTYVHRNGIPGVWFFSLDAANKLAVWAARKLYHLPYFNARMSLVQSNNTITYSSTRKDDNGPPATFVARWTIGDALPVSEIDSLEFFVTERYCLYSEHEGEIYRARIHHRPWPLRQAQVTSYSSSMVESLGVAAPEGAPALHYAEEIKVEIWRLESLDD